MENNKDRKIAIVDANNFYVSCERIFKPSLEGKGTVVLSNNDGCIIARSQEVKDQGIKMGQPLFLLDEGVRDGIHKFSSNYNLYGDISDRISNILRDFSPLVENYSIDESFIDVSHVPEKDIEDYLKTIKITIQKWVGIPVSIGCAENKTLAKLCNFISKKDSRFGGVYYHKTGGINLDSLSVDEVWGIGRKWSKKLNSIDIHTVGDFKKLTHSQARSLLTISGLRTLLELNGAYIHKISTKFKKPKMVTCSRSFGTSVWRKAEILDSLSFFLENGCKVLSGEGLIARRISIQIFTNRFEEDYSRWIKDIPLDVPTNNPKIVWPQIKDHLDHLPPKLWAKAGIVLKDLIPEKIIIKNIFVDSVEAVDLPINGSKNWRTKFDYLSQKYTTSWSDIPLIR